MLKYLHIENIAVIEQTDIEFTEGFNVLTGETGAGKSIIIDSLNAVLGERTSKDLIRSGCDNATVSALFGELSRDNLKELKAFDIEPDEDGNILITRRLSLSGKGLIKINSKPVTAAVLREISPILVNIHGQHDNQALLNPDKHCGFIDAVAENETLIWEYYSEFKNLNAIRKELNSLETDEGEKQRKIDLLKYQIKELTEADIKLGEIEKLKANLQIAENFEATQKALTITSGLISGDDETDGALTLLNNALKQLLSLKNDAFDSSIAGLNEVLSRLHDVSANVDNYISAADGEDLNADLINQRLDRLGRLMVKYGNSEEEMLEFLSNAENELENISCSDERIAELSLMLDKSKVLLVEKAKKVTETRVAAAKKFEEAVCEILSYLNMPNVQFKVQIGQGRYTKFGCDEVKFLISANRGEEPKPLNKIASGGELSRTMLAIKSALLGKDSVGTLIFDEIDTGISGFAAEKVGNQLKKTAADRQVICVTHLAQIAAKAHNHLLIEKSTRNERTFTNVTALDYEGKISEVARIMAGSELTENLYNSAKELLDRS